jgi:hypothetical protein
MRSFICAFLLIWACASAHASQIVISDVPSYIWYEGCGPTAAGMILGYWDAHGFGNLIPGSNSWDTNQQAVKNMIASPGQIRDYGPTPDRVPTADDPYHADDSIADFMGTSRNVGYGQSYENLQSAGMSGYMAYRGYKLSGGGMAFYGGLWTELVASIADGRPAEFYVDSNGDGSADHFVTVVGYDDTPGALKYAAYNTWDHDLHWYSFARVKAGQPFGVRSGTLFDPGPLPGDGNGDGLVDQEDYALWYNSYGQSGEALPADFNGDGLVDQEDYALWYGNYGCRATQVPEPMHIIGLVLLWVGCRRGRRASARS